MLAKNIFVLFLVFVCISCTSNYSDLGFSEKEWSSLTKNEQQQIIKKSKKLKWTHQQYTQHNVPSTILPLEMIGFNWAFFPFFKVMIGFLCRLRTSDPYPVPFS